MSGAQTAPDAVQGFVLLQICWQLNWIESAGGSIRTPHAAPGGHVVESHA
jgi:hypothetical protein